MKCEEIAELLPDYLQQGLQGEQEKIVERHLESCVECSEVAGLWKQLEGVTWTRREEHLDPQVLSALMHTLRYDQSVDVRLAALDALSRHAGQPQVKKTVVDALQEQQSPLVQVALIDQLVEWRDAEAAPRVEKVRQLPNLNPPVRQREDWG